MARDYYVASHGSDANPGTREAPWCTLAKVGAISLQPGDSVHLLAGETHPGNLVFGSISGTLEKPITLTSYCAEIETEAANPTGQSRTRAIIDAGGGTGIQLQNCEHWRISSLTIVGQDGNTGDGVLVNSDQERLARFQGIDLCDLEVRGFGKSGIAVEIAGGKTGFRDVRLEKVEAHSNGHAGICFRGDLSSEPGVYAHQNIQISHCHVHHNAGVKGLKTHSGNGILLVDVDTAVIKNSTAHHNGFRNTALKCGPAGIWACNSHKVLIQNCESHHNATASATDGGGFGLDGGTTESSLSGNYSHDNDGPGFLFSQFYSARAFRGNSICGNRSENDARKNDYGAIHVWAPEEYPMSDIEISNNEVHVARSERGRPRALVVQGPTQGLRIQENVFRLRGIPILVELTPEQERLVFESNVVESDEDCGAHWNGKSFFSLESWAAASGAGKVRIVATA